MNRDDIDWRGYWAAVPTPFNEDGSLALDLLRELLDFYIDGGLHGVLVNGTTGEWFSQSADERCLVAETAIDQVAGRVPIVIGATSYTADEVIGFARHAMDAGADGFASTPPPYAKPFEDEVIAFYEDIARGIDAPLVIYNWVHGTSFEMSPALADRLVDIDTVVAYKNSTPDADAFYEASDRVIDRVRVFGPYMSQRGLDHMLAGKGGDGIVGGGSLWGRIDLGAQRGFLAGDVEAARAHAIRTDELFPKLWLPGGWAGQHGHYASELKAAMAILGQPGATVRRPRLPITDPDKLAEMRAILEAAGVPKVGAAR